MFHTARHEISSINKIDVWIFFIFLIYLGLSSFDKSKFGAEGFHSKDSLYNPIKFLKHSILIITLQFL